MNVEEYKGFTRITGVTKDIIDLGKTFDCGQCFRWKSMGQDNYLGTIGNLVLMIRHMEFEDGLTGLLTTATVTEVNDMLLDYLQLHTDYDTKLQIDEADEFASKSAEYGRGIRILKQDPWETLVSFIISQRNNIPKIISTIEKMCRKLGNRVTLEVEGQTFESYTFPTASKIIEVGIEGLQDLGLGYRDSYILNAAELVSKGEIDLLDLINNHTGDGAVEELQRISGVGPKVANCVALFGLGKLDRFPIDVWMSRVIDTYYPNGIDIDKYGELAGLVQQYMFYYIRNNQ